ncbi:transposase family protein [Lysinibacillus sp. NPDC047702]|uniref:transposase family protein n=1 Tax=unclassified Lysinibacillus TaxID=2636778 RepID=UPI003D01B691
MLLPWQAPEKPLSLHLLRSYETTFVFSLQLTKSYAFCPSCGSRSSRIHSFYHRLLQDLSIGAQHVMIHLKSRKWFCDETWSTTNFHGTFYLVKSVCTKNGTLQLLLRNLAFSMSCRQAGKVIRSFIRACISHDTFLRLIRTTTIELPQTTSIGIEDFAFRKGHDYGTFICDLETHQPPAILQGRTSEIVEAWLKQHPFLQTISRDGSKTYREA